MWRGFGGVCGRPALSPLCHDHPSSLKPLPVACTPACFRQQGWEGSTRGRPVSLSVCETRRAGFPLTPPTLQYSVHRLCRSARPRALCSGCRCDGGTLTGLPQRAHSLVEATHSRTNQNTAVFWVGCVMEVDTRHGTVLCVLSSYLVISLDMRRSFRPSGEL